MRYFQANHDDARLDAETRRTFKGCARIKLDVLEFVGGKRSINRKHVEYLKNCFEKDRCRRLEQRNHIEAIIEQSVLGNALHQSGVTHDELLHGEPNGCPLLSFPKGFKLLCLTGQHRVEAANEFLMPHDKWWTVDLFITDVDSGLAQNLLEQHTNDEKPSDGEAYRKIRLYHSKRDIKSEAKWKACLRGCRLKNLNELLADDELTAAFDSLLCIPGIWYGMRLTTLQKMMAMGCKPEVINYLGVIRSGLLSLVTDELALARIDEPTMKALESRAPGASSTDADFLKGQIQGGVIFAAFTADERLQIINRLSKVDGMILTLASLFKDLNYLYLLIDCLTRLVHVPRRVSVCETIHRAYTGVNQDEWQVKIQSKDFKFAYLRGNDGNRVDLGCRSLIALAMRSYPYLPRETVRQDTVKKATARAEPHVLRRLAQLAYQQGFETEQIHHLRGEEENLEVEQNQAQILPLTVTSGRGIDLLQRTGIPRSQVYEADCNSFFLEYLHDAQLHQGEGITSFYVRKHIYLAFFGRPEELEVSGTEHSKQQESAAESQTEPYPDERNRQRIHLPPSFVAPPVVTEDPVNTIDISGVEHIKYTPPSSVSREEIAPEPQTSEVVIANIRQDNSRRQEAVAAQTRRREEDRRRREESIHKRPLGRLPRRHTQLNISKVNDMQQSEIGSKHKTSNPETTQVHETPIAFPQESGREAFQGRAPSNEIFIMTLDEQDKWKDYGPYDVSNFETIVQNSFQNNHHLYDIDLNVLNSADSLKSTMDKGNQVVIALPTNKLNINEELQATIRGMVAQFDQSRHDT